MKLLLLFGVLASIFISLSRGQTTDDPNIDFTGVEVSTYAEEEEDSGLSGGAIAGITIAVVVVVGAAVALPVYFLHFRKKSTVSAENGAQPDPDVGSTHS